MKFKKLSKREQYVILESYIIIFDINKNDKKEVENLKRFLKNINFKNKKEVKN